MKTGIHTLALDTPCMSPTEWYCPPAPSQSSTICSNCISLRALLWFVSWCKKWPTLLRSSSNFTEVAQNLSLYSYCPPTCYNSLCFSVNTLSLNCHKFILAFQIIGPHTDLIVT